MNEQELRAIVRGLAPTIARQIENEMGRLESRLAALERRELPVVTNGRDGRDGLPGVPGVQGEKGMPGDRGEQGPQGDPAPPVTREQILEALAADQTLIRDAVAAYLSANPPARGADGRDGVDGKDVSMATVSELVAAAVETAVKALPVPKDGRDGENGKDGKDGESVSTAEIAHMVETSVASAVKSIPPAKDGRDGIDGKDGADGVGMTGAMLSRDGELVLTLSNGEIKTLGIVVGKDGEPGRDGQDGAKGTDGRDGVDGVGFKDLEEAIEDGGRVLVHRYRNDDQVKEFRHKTASPVYRGVFQDGKTYERGDQVTWGGSTWIANKSTDVKPDEHGEGARAWTLSTKRGRDGKQGPEGKSGPQGPKGDKGDPGPPRY